MPDLIDINLLSEYDEYLKDVASIWQKSKSYSLEDIIQYRGYYLKCTTAGTSGSTTLDVSNISVGDTISDGTCVWTRIDQDKRGIDYWASSTTYALNDQVVNDNKIYKCSTAHTSTSTFDATKWTEVGGGGGTGIETWTSGTSYNSGDIVLKDNTIYVANTTTSTIWVSSEWDVVNDTTLVGGTYYSQKALTGIVQPYTTTLIVADTNYCKPPVEVMKHYSGTSPTSTNLETYTNSIRYSFDDTKIQFSGGSVSLINPRYIKTSAPEDISGLNVTTSDLIDFSEYVIEQQIDNNTLALLHFDGDTIIDECGNTIPTNLSVGLPTLDNSAYKFGNASAYFDGYREVGIPYDSKFDFGTGDFTVDFWWKQPTSGNIFTNDAATIFGQRLAGVMIIFIYNNSLYIGKSNQGFQTAFSANARYTDGEFHHFAIVRASGVVYLFIDGELKESGNNNSSYVFASGYIGIGNQDVSSSYNGIIGNIDEFRISNIARWTSDFTPPTEPYHNTYQVQNITKVPTSSQEYQEVYS